MGDGLAITAMMLDFHDRGTGGATIAALFLALAVPSVAVAGLAGRIADRVPLQKVLYGAGTALVLVCVTMAYARSVVITVLLTAVLAGLMAVVMPATQKAVASSTSDALLSKAQARMSMSANMGMLLGPPIAGVLMDVADVRVALLIDAVTYLALPVSAWLLPPAAPARSVRGRSGLVPGLRAISAQPTLIRVIGLGLVIIFAMQVTNVAEVFLVKDELHASSTAFGLITMVLAGGQLAGAWSAGVVLTRSGTPLSPSAVALIAVAATGVAVFLVSVSTRMDLVFVLTALNGLALGGFAVARQTILVRLTDSDLHGSVFAAHGALLNTTVSAGLLMAGVMTALIGPRMVYAVTGLLLLASLTMTLLPGKLPRRSREGSSPKADRAATRAEHS